jgi:hypothetical protein
MRELFEELNNYIKLIDTNYPETLSSTKRRWKDIKNNLNIINTFENKELHSNIKMNKRKSVSSNNISELNMKHNNKNIEKSVCVKLRMKDLRYLQLVL